MICHEIESWVLIMDLNPIDKIVLLYIWIMSLIMDLNPIDKIVLLYIWIMSLIMDLNSIDKIVLPCIWIVSFSNIAKHEHSWVFKKEWDFDLLK